MKANVIYSGDLQKSTQKAPLLQQPFQQNKDSDAIYYK